MSKGFVQIFILNVLEYLDSSSKSRVYQVSIPNSYICVGDDGGMCYWRWDFRVTIV